jgi:hypothetical protein
MNHRMSNLEVLLDIDRWQFLPESLSDTEWPGPKTNGRLRVRVFMVISDMRSWTRRSTGGADCAWSVFQGQWLTAAHIPRRIHMAIILIQHVHTVWTKRSRGGDGSRIRSAIPLAVMLLSNCDSSSGWILHRATYSERDRFERSDHCVRVTEFGQLRLLDLEVRSEGDGLSVRFCRRSDNAARPSTLSFTDLPCVEGNRWCRVRFNGRFVDWDTGNWWYEHSSYNIGRFDTYSAAVFLTSSPTNRFEEVVTLR